MQSFLVLFGIFQIVTLVHTVTMAATGWFFKAHVEAVALGFGPPLFQIRLRETSFRINWFLFGGHAKFAGREDEDEFHSDPIPAGKLPFQELHPFHRILICLSGNFALLLAVAVGLGIVTALRLPAVETTEINTAALQWKEGSGDYSTMLTLIPSLAYEQVFSSESPAPLRQLMNLAAVHSAALVYVFCVLAFICASYNLLPIPVFNGGHAILIAIEWIRGRPLPEKLVIRLTMICLFVLLAMSPIFWWRLLRA